MTDFTPEQITKVEGLRDCYSSDDRIHKLLDALATDMRKDKMRKKTLADAEKIKAVVGPTATVYRIIAGILG